MPDNIQAAYEAFDAGDFNSARTLCRNILIQDPDQPKALNLLGLIHYHQGDGLSAVDHFRHAVAHAPDDVEILYNYAVVLSHLDRAPEARAILEAVVNRKPDFPEAYFMLGNACFQRQQFAEAVIHYRQALTLRQRYQDAWFNLGLAQKKLRRYEPAADAFRQSLALLPDHASSFFQLALVLQASEQKEPAIDAYRRALALTPQDPLILNNIGILLRETGRFEEAIELLSGAVDALPENLSILNELGLAYHDTGRYHEAIEVFQSAVRLGPDFPEALSNLGNSLQEINRFEEAIPYYEKALALNPEFHEARYNLGNCYLLGMNDLDSAIASYREAIALKPDFVEGHWNLSHALLLKGRFQEGFQEYLWRWRRKATIRLDIPRPEWKGEEIPDQTLLVHTEQGLGDAIQFVRYLPQVQARAGKIYLACDRPLIPLFQSLKGVDAIISKKNLSPVYAVIDRHVPLLNLPSIFTDSEAAIPAAVPYLAPDRKLVDAHSAIFAAAPSGFRIGIVWQGNPQHKNDINRSCRLAYMAPLFDLPKAVYFSLQKDRRPGGGPDFPGIDLAPHMQSFADTAALMTHLDLVISVDTSAAHLAGALGMPVWTLLPYAPDWRWLLDREDSPWYPTMRLFRQPRPRDWAPVMERIAAELEKTIVHT